MTDTGKTGLHKALETYDGRRPGVARDAIIKEVEDILEKLMDDGVLSIGKDDHLTGRSLEIRVYHLFRAMGFCVEYGRPKLEDMVVTPPAGANTIRPLVIEVKSDHRGGAIQRDHLRQLDDWVFDLSGKEEARKFVYFRSRS